MALSAHALTLYSTVRDALGFTSSDDATIQTKLERIISAVSEEMESLAARHFEYGAAITERKQGFGGHRLVLDRAPLKTITSIALMAQDGTVSSTYTSTDYEIDEDGGSGMIYMTSGFPWTCQQAGDILGSPLPGSERSSLRVVYAGGWVTPAQAAADVLLTRDLPYDLEEACISSAVAVYRRSGRDRSIAAETSAGGSSVSYVNPNVIISEGASFLTPEAQRIVQRYWRGT